jgi:hypothetical protein
MNDNKRSDGSITLPDHYQTVAQDIMDHAARQDGVWMDVGSGGGGLGLAMAACHKGVMILLDPNERALEGVISQAAERRLLDRVIPVIGTAESIPLPAGAVDVVISRGIVLFLEGQSRGTAGNSSRPAPRRDGHDWGWPGKPVSAMGATGIHPPATAFAEGYERGRIRGVCLGAPS